MSTINELLEKTKKGFNILKVDEKYKKQALVYIKEWLTEKEYKDYFQQLKHFIDSNDWDYLLDCFYQIIPFGTGGRRGEVGIGPNRINKWTVQASAQGHSQYLKKIYKERALTSGVVLAYGIREFYTNKHFSESLPNPVKNLTGKDLAEACVQVYSANGIKVYLFEGPRTTPELSFSIRELKAVAGDMFDASHNPPEHNGKKVYDEFGGQLIPPDDEVLVNEVTKNVKRIKIISLDEARSKNLLVTIGEKIDEAYIEAVKSLSLSDERNIVIVYTPLHGVGMSSVLATLKGVGFNVISDPSTNYYSGKFENITFNIPNPEVRESFDTTLKFAKEKNADLILNSDPDADRIGVMVNKGKSWAYLNGNEIGSILTRFVIEKKKKENGGKGVVVKTSVTTNLATQICNFYGVEIIGELPVGFKYIGEVMNNLEKEGRIDNFFIGLEESHGYIAGNYLRDKDSAIGALWLAELAAELKKQSKTVCDYLDETYSKFGYFRNYLTEIRLPGAEGMTNIQKIQKSLREEKPQSFGNYKVKSVEDFWDRKPIVSETDRITKDVLVFHFETINGYSNIKVTVRPSGTEPKIKMYFEIGNKASEREMEDIKTTTEKDLIELEKLFMTHCYKIIGVNFPERAFFLFWQLPLKDKLRYFEIEPSIVNLRKEQNKDLRKKKLYEILEFLGSDPVEKVDGAFKEKYKKTIYKYLELYG